MRSPLSIVDDQPTAQCSTALFNVTASGSAIPAGQYRGNAAVITLGCAKNQVDSEVMLGSLRKSGYQIVSDPESAEVIIVNTCGFLESSVKESIDCILDVAELKKSARLRRLIVAGCMVQRYNGDIQSSFPEVDAFIGVDDLLLAGEVAQGSQVRSMLEGAARPYFIYDEKMPRQLSTRPHTAYVKVSEGCDRPCAFCIIPKIRGAMRSRPIDSIVAEARALAAYGVKEINLVAQDLTSYGKDRRDGGDLVTLLRELDRSSGIPWIRLLYAYPVGITQELMQGIEQLPNICEYLDIPLQHSSEAVLRAMKRPIGRYAARSIVDFMRSCAPQVKLRTTFIVGFPGETEKDIHDLEQFISEGHFSSVGVFTYSRENGTPAAELGNQIPDKEKELRRDRLMQTQQRVVEAGLRESVGKTFPVLVEGLHEESDLLLSGRARFQAPEVDGCVIINDLSEESEERSIPAGEIRNVLITDASGYDLIGRL